MGAIRINRAKTQNFGFLAFHGGGLGKKKLGENSFEKTSVSGLGGKAREPLKRLKKKANRATEIPARKNLRGKKNENEEAQAGPLGINPNFC